ncbi:MAG: hypothetical protein WAZ19_16495, partial [Anaerolineae bacterium]
MFVEGAPYDTAANAQAFELREEHLSSCKIVGTCGGPLVSNRRSSKRLESPVVEEALNEIRIKRCP